jgi:hypothetical protein
MFKARTGLRKRSSVDDRAMSSWLVFFFHLFFMVGNGVLVQFVTGAGAHFLYNWRATCHQWRADAQEEPSVARGCSTNAATVSTGKGAKAGQKLSRRKC